MEYYDIHTHQEPVHPEDVAIVNRIVGIGSVETEASTASQYSYGIHPWYLGDISEQLDRLRQLVSGSEVVAIGEAGFDKMAKTSLSEQERAFMGQVALSEEIGKPLIIHCVKAWAELVACHKKLYPRQPWIIHGFRGNGELAAQLINQGFYLSFGEHFQPSAVLTAWPGSLFAETDDKPIDIRTVYHNLSQSLSIPESELASQIAKNFHVFNVNQ